MKKYLITGSSGFVGSHLVKSLRSDYEFVLYDIKRGFSVLDKTILREAMKDCDGVIHLAALCDTAHCWENPTSYYENNVVGSSNIAEIAISLGIKRVIFASSTSIYVGAENPYAASKVMTEAVFQVRRDELASIGMRFCNIFGKNQNPSYGAAIPNFIRGITKGEITIYGDGKQTRDFVHVDDICRFIKTAIEKDYKGLPRFVCLDIGKGKSHTVYELVQTLMNLMGKEAKIKYAPSRKEKLHQVADMKLAKDLFNFQTKVTLKEGLKRLLKEGL